MARLDARRSSATLTDTQVRNDVGADQIDYYRARAPWYDDAYTCQGDYDRGPALNAAWLGDLATVEVELAGAGLHGDCVELGAGTGFWTEKVVDRVDRIWALDAVAEVLDTARTRLGPRADKVEFEVVDLWQWEPSRAFDCALACFFLEHVPDEVLPRLLTTLHGALAPGGIVFVAEGAATVEPGHQVEARFVAERRFQVIERRRTAAEMSDVFAASGFLAKVGETGGPERLVWLTATSI